jgi:hypothetical protein
LDAFIICFLYQHFNLLYLLYHPLDHACEGGVFGSPQSYYSEYRIEYEESVEDQQQRENLLKASYINELEIAIAIMKRFFEKKLFLIPRFDFCAHCGSLLRGMYSVSCYAKQGHCSEGRNYEY